MMEETNLGGSIRRDHAPQSGEMRINPLPSPLLCLAMNFECLTPSNHRRRWRRRRWNRPKIHKRRARVRRRRRQEKRPLGCRRRQTSI